MAAANPIQPRNVVAPKKAKNTHGRQQRPAPLTSRETPRKSCLKSSRHSSRGEQQVQDDSEDMTSGFPQFCTVCEKQIAIPNANVLYCSESCRKIDSQPSPAFSLFMSDAARSPELHNSYFNGTPARDLVPQMSPTPSARNPSLSSFPLTHPSESSTDAGASSADKTTEPSEAAAYLRKFHPGSTRMTSRRPSRASASTVGGMGPPSLSTTPDSTASSLPYTPVEQRPLPPRTVRRANANSWCGGPIDLVTPVSSVDSSRTSPSTERGAYGVHELSKVSSVSSDQTITEQAFGRGVHMYEKRELGEHGASAAKSSLQALFRSDKLRG